MNKAEKKQVASAAGHPHMNGQAHTKHLNWLERYAPWLLIGAGLLGTFASLMLSIEEIDHLKHPAAKLACDLNPIIGCGANMDVWQGHVFFGVPNELFGLITFVVVATVGVAILAGARFKRWFWLGLQGGLLFGVTFVHWFMFQSLLVIKHLCPYCMLTWLAVIVCFWYILLYGIRAEHIRLHGSLARINRFIQQHHADILVFWLLSIVTLILWRFWYYWQTLI